MTGETDKTRWRGVQPVLGISGIWPARDSVRFADSEKLTGSGSSDFDPVPANKILFISLVLFTSRLSSDQSAGAYLQIYDEGDNFILNVGVHEYFAKGQLASTMMFNPALELAAGWYFKVVATHANQITFPLVFGWLEDA